MTMNVSSVMVDGKVRSLNIPTGVRALLWKLGFKLVRL